MLSVNEHSLVAGSTKHSGRRRGAERNEPWVLGVPSTQFSWHDAAVCEGAFPRPGQRPRAEKAGEARAVPAARKRASGAAKRRAAWPKAEKFFHLYLREVGRVTAPGPAEQLELAARSSAGDKEARGRLLRGCLPLVVRIARQYEEQGLGLLELVSEGNFGLVQALERFETLNQADFQSFASWWVRRAIERVLASEPKGVAVPIRFRRSAGGGEGEGRSFKAASGPSHFQRSPAE